MKRQVSIFIILLIIIAGISVTNYISEKNKIAKQNKDEISGLIKTDIQVNPPSNTSSSNSSTYASLIPKEQNQNGDSAKATLSYDGQFYMYLIKASLTNLANNKFYQAWLKKDSQRPEYFALGKLAYKEGEYSLNIVSEIDRSDFKKMIISEETDRGYLGSQPEKIILEGSF